jgi:acylphosphatase
VSASEKTVTAVAHGQVQGVFFRDSCRQRANELHIRGWVRNRPDGAVEALFCGPAADVDAMVDWIRSGPAHAQVSRIETFDTNDPGIAGFEVR